MRKCIYSAEEAPCEKVGPFKETWQRIKTRPIAMISLGLVVFILLLAIFADVLYDYDKFCVKQDLTQRFLGPSWQHLLGTDMYGRDMAGRIVHGSRAALLMGGVGSVITISISTVLACFAAYFGGKVDNAIMRTLDILACIPGLILAIAICAGLGGGLWQLVTALAVSGLVGATRMIRSKAISVVNMDYLESAVALGASTLRIMRKNILKNIMDIIIIVLTGQVAMYIMMGTTLSFIGLGVQSPKPEWGLMVNETVAKMQLHPMLAIIPGIAIVLTTLSVGTLGDCLRDALDPKLKGKS